MEAAACWGNALGLCPTRSAENARTDLETDFLRSPAIAELQPGSRCMRTRSPTRISSCWTAQREFSRAATRPLKGPPARRGSRPSSPNSKRPGARKSSLQGAGPQHADQRLQLSAALDFIREGDELLWSPGSRSRPLGRRLAARRRARQKAARIYIGNLGRMRGRCC